MVRPSLEEVRQLAKEYTVVPVSREIFSDVKTTIALLQNIRELSGRYFLLESVEGGEKWGRYSFLGFDPVVEVSIKDGRAEIKNGAVVHMSTDTPNDVVREILSQYKSPKMVYLPPFTGGFVGYFSYDYFKYNEKALEIRATDESGFEDMDLMLFDQVIAFDHLRQKIVVIVNMRTDDVEVGYKKAEARLEEIIRMINMPAPKKRETGRLTSPLALRMGQEEYCDKVRAAKRAIYDGEIFQVVLSNRYEAGFEGSLLDTYRVLRTTNPSPYMVYMKLGGGTEIASTSPETLVRLQDGVLSSFPIAGSRPRGKDEDADAALEAELLEDEKELAEHNMLVDLARNDIGKISEFGSVGVRDYLKIHRYSHIMHIVSTVNGKMRKDLDQLDALSATLVAGTLSGAPKIRACEIIDELEPMRRGIYGGALGYIDFSGNMDLCIAIRMAAKKDGKVYVQAGAGIVADSVPETEFVECSNKAKAVLDAIEAAQGGIDL
jgi:anthranilate synthase component 1